MDKAVIRTVLENARVIAILGASDRPGRPVDKVGRYLIQAGYDIIPVHPVRKTVWGLPCYASLAAIERPVDIIDVFRAPEYCPAHAREAAGLSSRPLLFWMQQGIASPETAEILDNADILHVQDRCLMVEHMRLFHAG